jgi:hypothetical protein
VRYASTRVHSSRDISVLSQSGLVMKSAPPASGRYTAWRNPAAS